MCRRAISMSSAMRPAPWSSRPHSGRPFPPGRNSAFINGWVGTGRLSPPSQHMDGASGFSDRAGRWRSGPAFREEVLRMRGQGLKTEPTFASLLGLKGDPYRAARYRCLDGRPAGSACCQRRRGSHRRYDAPRLAEGGEHR
ncbi:DUF4269 domain-containing protein (plasmid) [Azospirillum brasilense]|uniref:DUF4269 domain-containing protein n=1 Tax=Azospirillum brasilense TaxID=192 RepID=A0A4D8QSI9_AZOBR|nr:DUF4269 domain-containing protein [Azospirillum brasilense]QEL94024.1 DUF4269 domain-containing protein [Azospirillum brasilense]QEM00330.1 DUF4269 domain-containing protein [Azospirillum brasilense]